MVLSFTVLFRYYPVPAGLDPWINLRIISQNLISNNLLIDEGGYSLKIFSLFPALHIFSMSTNQVAGIDVFFLARILPAIFGAITLLFVYLVFRKINPVAGLLSSGIFIFYAWTSIRLSYFVFESLGFLLFIAVIYCYLATSKKQDARAYFLIIGLFSLLVLTHYLTAYFALLALFSLIFIESYSSERHENSKTLLFWMLAIIYFGYLWMIPTPHFKVLIAKRFFATPNQFIIIVFPILLIMSAYIFRKAPALGVYKKRRRIPAKILRKALPPYRIKTTYWLSLLIMLGVSLFFIFAYPRERPMEWRVLYILQFTAICGLAMITLSGKHWIKYRRLWSVFIIFMISFIGWGALGVIGYSRGLGGGLAIDVTPRHFIFLGVIGSGLAIIGLTILYKRAPYVWPLKALPKRKMLAASLAGLFIVGYCMTGLYFSDSYELYPLQVSANEHSACQFLNESEAELTVVYSDVLLSPLLMYYGLNYEIGRSIYEEPTTIVTGECIIISSRMHESGALISFPDDKIQVPGIEEMYAGHMGAVIYNSDEVCVYVSQEG